jgi:hypothetical protein
MPPSDTLRIGIVYRKGRFIVSSTNYRGMNGDEHREFDLIGNTPLRAFANGAKRSKIQFRSADELIYWLGECEAKGLRLEPSFDIRTFGLDGKPR